MQKWEGGLSRDPYDSASSIPAPWVYNGHSGWHTNKGITYAAFKAHSAESGYIPSKENFFQMPEHIWLKVLRNGYMKPYPLQKINNLPSIQAVIITWAWGSGLSGSEKQLAKFQRTYFGIQDADITKEEIVDNFKKRVNLLNEKQVFHALCDHRLSFFKSLPSAPQHLKGWTNRLNEFRKLFG